MYLWFIIKGPTIWSIGQKTGRVFSGGGGGGRVLGKRIILFFFYIYKFGNTYFYLFIKHLYINI